MYGLRDGGVGRPIPVGTYTLFYRKFLVFAALRALSGRERLGDGYEPSAVP
jgi:hypothetical protein